MILPNTNNGNMLPLADNFYSIQGEGYNSGKPVYFIRLGGCDVGCRWCDSKETWNAMNFSLVSINEIVKLVTDTPAKYVVITGGEPCLYDLTQLCNELKNFNIEIFLETSGSSPIIGTFDWITVSPKKNKAPLDSSISIASELKVVIEEMEDFKWAELNRAKTNDKCKLYLQPEWSKIDNILPKIIDYTMKNPIWNISLQVHKYMNIK